MSIYPSVTTVLKLNGYYDDLDAAGEDNQTVGKERGSALHKGCHWLAMGQEPPWREPHPELDRFLNGYRRFKKEHDFRLHEHEAEWINDTERLIAHPDEYGILDDYLSVIEIKTGTLPKWVGKQLGGQVIARRKADIRRFALSLPGDDNYKLIPFTDYQDLIKFRALHQAVLIRAEDQGSEIWK